MITNLISIKKDKLPFTFGLKKPEIVLFFLSLKCVLREYIKIMFYKSRLNWLELKKIKTLNTMF